MRAGDAADLQSRDRAKSFKQRVIQFQLIDLNSGHSLFEGQSAPAERSLIVRREFGTKGVTQPRKILHRAKGTSDRLKTLCARLELIRGQIPGGTNFIRRQAVKQFVLAVENAKVRPKELVGRASQEITVQRLHIDWPVWSVLDGIHETERTCPVGKLYHPAHIIDSADSV